MSMISIYRVTIFDGNLDVRENLDDVDASASSIFLSRPFPLFVSFGDDVIIVRRRFPSIETSLGCSDVIWLTRRADKHDTDVVAYRESWNVYYWL